MHDKGQISAIRLMFAIACFMQGSSLLTAFLSQTVERESWLVAVVGPIVFLFFLWVYWALVTRFSGKGLVEILKDVYGKILGTFLSVLYAWFFLTLTALNLLDMGAFMKLTMMRDTPRRVLSGIVLLVAAWGARHGAQVVMRYGPLFVYIACAITISTILLSTNQMNLGNLVPTFEHSPKEYLQSLHIMVTIPFGELVAFLVIMPEVKATAKELGKAFLLGHAIGAGTILAMLVRDIAVLGDTICLFTLPSLVTLRLVSLGADIERIEILFAIVLMELLFFKVTLLLFVTAKCISDIFRLKDPKPIMLALAALILVYTPTLYWDPVTQMIAARDEVPIVWTFFEFLLPVLTLLVAAIAGKPSGSTSGKGGK